MGYIYIVVNASDSMRMGRNTLFFPRFLEFDNKKIPCRKARHLVLFKFKKGNYNNAEFVFLIAKTIVPTKIKVNAKKDNMAKPF